ncbi:MAG: DNA-3-methyladenine glycosylase I [bacterium]
MSQDWAYRDTLPPDDSAYFENLTRCIFQAGLNWKMITNKWPGFTEAFARFDVEKVAGFGDEDVERLMADKGIVRNRRKITATIGNAQEFRRIAGEHGSFKEWFTGLDKSDNYAGVTKALREAFSQVGNSTANIFIYTVGEDIKQVP